MPPLKVIGLISGGKDSLFTLLHCLHHGHQIVALANLYPGPRGGKGSVAASISGDIDSHMYQTVGHSVIPLYAKALDLPLYRREILGKAVQATREYRYTPGSLDETEDLFSLLLEVKSHHPDADAVCSGAILSTYQRTRVESVALRLNLTPLSYLWQYPVLPRVAADSDSMTGLLDDMAAAGCEARIIKVASGGLDEDLLWADVCDERTRQRLIHVMARFIEAGDESVAILRGAALGEGGEYETLALRGPSSLWRYSIQVDSDERIVVGEEGGTSSLAIAKASLVPQDSSQPSKQQTIQVPALMSTTFSNSQSSFLSAPSSPMSAKAAGTSHASDSFLSPLYKRNVYFHAPSDTLYVCNLLPSTRDQPPSTQIQSLLDGLMHLLSTHNKPFSPSSILHTTILLRDINMFPMLNNMYASLPLSDPLPPSRVTISVGDTLPQGHDLSMSFILSPSRLGTPRKGLHVQSRSYWAPCNIGPYSQAITHPLSGSDGELTYLAGQIPLVPATMMPLSDEVPFIQHALLALQHLWRVGRATGVQWWVGGGVAFLARRANAETLTERVRAVSWAWRCIHRRPDLVQDLDVEDSDGEIDVWDQRFNRLQRPRGHNLGLEDEEKLPNWSVVGRNSESDVVPPLLVVEVESLPRRCAVEWSSVGLSACDQSKVHVCAERGKEFSSDTCHVFPAGGTRPLAVTDAAVTFTVTSFRNDEEDHDLQTFAEKVVKLVELHLITDGTEDAAHVTAYVPTSPMSRSLTEVVERKWPGRVLLMPCHSLWDIHNQKLLLSLSIRYERVQSHEGNISVA